VVVSAGEFDPITSRYVPGGIAMWKLPVASVVAIGAGEAPATYAAVAIVTPGFGVFVT
jgi:hypothetical protein